MARDLAFGFAFVLALLPAHAPWWRLAALGGAAGIVLAIFLVAVLRRARSWLVEVFADAGVAASAYNAMDFIL